MTDPARLEASTPQELTTLDLAEALGITRRAALDLLQLYTSTHPTPLRAAERRTTLIPQAAFDDMVRVHRLARSVHLSVASLLALRQSQDPELWAFLGRPTEPTTTTPADLTQVMQQLQEVQRNQAHLLRVVAPLVRQNTPATVPPGPAPVPVRAAPPQDD